LLQFTLKLFVEGFLDWRLPLFKHLRSILFELKKEMGTPRFNDHKIFECEFFLLLAHDVELLLELDEGLFLLFADESLLISQILLLL